MPTRYLKPGIRDSEAIDALSPMAECLFYRLLVTVDDFGRYDGRAAMVRAHCFPIKTITVEQCSALLGELARSGLVSLYTVEEKPFLQVSKWDNVPRAKESKFPAPSGGCMQVHTDARIPSTHLPETETETETETGDRKPITDARSRADAPRKRDAKKSTARPDDVSEQVWQDWQTLRKAKRAPVTDTVVERIRVEAGKVGMTVEEALRTCCARGWQGFEAEWVEKERRPVQHPTFGKPAVHPSFLNFGSRGDVIDA